MSIWKFFENRRKRLAEDRLIEVLKHIPEASPEPEYIINLDEWSTMEAEALEAWFEEKKR